MFYCVDCPSNSNRCSISIVCYIWYIDYVVMYEGNTWVCLIDFGFSLIRQHDIKPYYIYILMCISVSIPFQSVLPRHAQKTCNGIHLFPQKWNTYVHICVLSLNWWCLVNYTTMPWIKEQLHFDLFEFALTTNISYFRFNLYCLVCELMMLSFNTSND